MQKKKNKNKRIQLKEQFKTFARSESDWTLRLVLSSLITNISNTRQSKLLLHFIKKYKSNFDCLVFEMFVINELRTSLNVQSDSLRAKVLNCSFNWILLFLFFFFCMLYFILLSFSNIYYSTLHIYMLILLPFFILTSKWPKIGRNVVFIRDFYWVKFIKRWFF